MRRYTGHEQDFEWDVGKAEANLRKHGVSFEEAMTSFADPFGICLPDRGHAEQRFILLAMSERERLLYTVHAERDRDAIRIISARLATKHERKRYEQGEDD